MQPSWNEDPTDPNDLRPGDALPPWAKIEHLCAGSPMYRPHTMLHTHNGVLYEVTGRWDGAGWTDLKIVREAPPRCKHCGMTAKLHVVGFCMPGARE